jgi:microcompartment protein CcmK/EutM
MILARVIGTVVSTCKNDRLVGKKLQIVQPLQIRDMSPKGDPIVAVDTVGAGESEVVMVVAGSSARQTEQTNNTPVDAVIMGIIDSVELEGKLVFTKS